MVGFIFGGNTGLSNEELQRRRQIAQALMQQKEQPTNVATGLASATQSIVGALLDRKLGKEEDKRREEYNQQFSSVMGAPDGSRMSTSGAPMPSVTPMTPAEGVASDAMTALGKSTPTRAGIRSGLIQRGLPPHVADGFIANMQDESGLNPGINERNPIVPGSRGGFGLSQWTGPRRRNLEAFAQQQGKPVDDLDLQLDFLVSELQGPESRAANAIFSTKNANDAAIAIARDFLRPAPEHLQSRTQKYANMDFGELAQLASSPYANDNQKAIVNALMTQQVKQQDPAYQLGLQKSQLELEQMRNPQMTPYQRAQIEMAQAKAADGSTEYGLTPQYITDAEGNLKMVQLGKDGSVNEVKLPEGAAIQKGVEKLDLGTHFQWHNTITGEPIGEPIPKELRAAEREKAIGSTEGKSQAEATQAAPAAIAKAESALALINDVMNDPALPGITGMLQGRLPPMSQAGTDLNVKIEQIKGKAFLEAFESLKGGGTITEREGQAAQNAIARLDRAQSTEAYQEALSDLKAIIETGLQRARGNLGEQPQANAAMPGRFDSMDRGALLQVNIDDLTSAELDAYEAALKRAMQ